MSRSDFHDLLTRYLKGNCSEEEKTNIQEWYRLLDSDTLAGIRPEELDNIEARMWKKLNETYHLEQPVQASTVYSIWTKLAAAIVISGILLVCGYLLLQERSGNSELPVSKILRNPIERTNTSNHPLKLLLEDSSMVTIQPGSSLSIPVHFDNSRREVYLKGEGFFQIRKDNKKPFFVYNRNTITQVVGTSFIVRTDKISNRTEVIVKSGKVIVMSSQSQNILDKLLAGSDNVTLTPNLRTIYNTDKKQFITTLAESPISLKNNDVNDEKREFAFSETSVKKVLDLLEETYGIKIIAEDKKIYQCTFTGDISDISLYNKLDLICQATGATYKIKETTIYIQGSACK